MLGIQILIYAVAAIGPAAVLLYYIYKHDKVEKEPGKLLVKLLIQGVLAALLSMALETVGENILDMFLYEDSAWYWIFMAFLVVAVAEEGTKFLLMDAIPVSASIDEE